MELSQLLNEKDFSKIDGLLFGAEYTAREGMDDVSVKILDMAISTFSSLRVNGNASRIFYDRVNGVNTLLKNNLLYREKEMMDSLNAEQNYLLDIGSRY